MARFLLLVSLLGVSSAFKFEPVYDWEPFDYNWPSEEIKNKTLNGSRFDLRQIEPWYLAVYEDRMFLSLSRFNSEVPAILVWLPISQQSTSPKLTPFTSLELQEFGNKKAMQDVRGVEVDSTGRLWAVDNGNYEEFPGKLWIFDLRNNDTVILVHSFPSQVVDVPRELNAVALDQTSDDWFAYVSDLRSLHLIVFSLARNASWSVDIGQNRASGLAISPCPDRSRLFVAEADDEQMLGVALTELRAGNRNLSVSLLGRRESRTSKMAMNRKGVLYSEFMNNRSLNTWNTKQPFKEESFYLGDSLLDYYRPIVFNFDQADNLWLLTANKISPRFRLFKAAPVDNARC
ncbi:major royal jelly protein 1-like [Cloeon dipterum]|uniref:major royal jelly protein 1-like n=1 Tax=Cloeon dipterum TaxID=197152 RepID=UPI00321FFBC0